MDENSTKESLASRYNVNWDAPLGEGSFGAVFLASNRKTGEKVAVKKISKTYTNDDEFYREMTALLHVRQAGGHPGICSLREHFNECGHYYLILDLISGGGTIWDLSMAFTVVAAVLFLILTPLHCQIYPLYL